MRRKSQPERVRNDDKPEVDAALNAPYDNRKMSAQESYERSQRLDLGQGREYILVVVDKGIGERKEIRLIRRRVCFLSHNGGRVKGEGI